MDGVVRIDVSAGPAAHEPTADEANTVAANPFWITARLVTVANIYLNPFAPISLEELVHVRAIRCGAQLTRLRSLNREGRKLFLIELRSDRLHRMPQISSVHPASEGWTPFGRANLRTAGRSCNDDLMTPYLVWNVHHPGYQI